jgi:predicted N-acetyltransferase YhbS
MTLEDCAGVAKMYQGEPGWWHEEDMCREITKKRLAHGFYVTVALRSGEIVGHAEWLPDRDRDGAYWYLGELQVMKTQQKTGVVRAILEEGVACAHRRGLSRVLVIPEQDTGSEAFYAKCGFQRVNETKRVTLAATSGPASCEWRAVVRVPSSVLETKTLVFGLTVASPRHMWTVENDKISEKYDKFISDAFALGNGDFVQFRHKPGEKWATALLWCSAPSSASVSIVLHCAAAAGIASVLFEFLAEYAPLLEGCGSELNPGEILMERPVTSAARASVNPHSGTNCNCR